MAFIAKEKLIGFYLFALGQRRLNRWMPEQITYAPEDIVHDCRVIEAIWKEIKDDLSNKAQVAIAYATCSTLADLIEIKIDHLESNTDEQIWPEGTSPAYFLEKVTGLISSFGYLAENILTDKDFERDKDFVHGELFKLRNALPNFMEGYKAFVRDV